MDCPAFCVTGFGLFDSRVKYPHLTRSTPRPVREYELEFFPADFGHTYIGDRAISMLHGTFLCAKPGQTRYSDLPFRCYYIHMTTEDPRLRGLLDALPDTGTLPRMAPVTDIFQELLVLDTDQPTAPLILQGCVCRLLELLAGVQPLPQPGSQTELLLRAERYIQTHLAENLTLQTVAAAVNLSPFHFHRTFTDFFGCTPGQYITSCRVAGAKLRLLQEDFSLPAIASEFGFSSQSYFCYRFKQATGMTPLEYRRATLGRMDF